MKNKYGMFAGWDMMKIAENRTVEQIKTIIENLL